MSHRCQWAEKSPQLLRYHDLEWGVPVRDERQLFENLALEVFQAGLNWQVILRYRPALKVAFAQFDAERIAHFTVPQIKALYTDPTIIRNRAKIDAVIENARVLTGLHDLGWQLSETLWQQVNQTPLDHQLREGDVLQPGWFVADLVQTLKQLGFKRIGPKTCYALLQASGMVNDHLQSCFRHDEVAGVRPDTGFEVVP